MDKDLKLANLLVRMENNIQAVSGAGDVCSGDGRRALSKLRSGSARS